MACRDVQRGLGSPAYCSRMQVTQTGPKIGFKTKLRLSFFSIILSVHPSSSVRLSVPSVRSVPSVSHSLGVRPVRPIRPSVRPVRPRRALFVSLVRPSSSSPVHPSRPSVRPSSFSVRPARLDVITIESRRHNISRRYITSRSDDNTRGGCDDRTRRVTAKRDDRRELIERPYKPTQI